MINNRRRLFIEGALIALGSVFIPPSASALKGNLKFVAQNKLNVLLITVDDMDWESTGLFKPRNQQITPNINMLGQEGITFKNSHVAVSGCWQSRAAIFSGRLPHRNGVTAFKPMDEDVLVFPEILQSAGYLTGLAGKTSHTLPKRKYAFDRIYSNEEIKHGRDPDSFYRVTKDFADRAKHEKKPFLLNLNIEDPHRPFCGSQEDRDLSVYIRNYLEKIDPFNLDILQGRPIGEAVFRQEDVFVPGFLPDIPEIRNELAFYYSSVARADLSVGRILEALAESGLENETLVIFLSDNGMHFPFAKGNVYPFSTAASLVIRSPTIGNKEGLIKNEFVSSVDLFPTILETLGIGDIRYLDGRSLNPILKGDGGSDRDQCFTYRHQFPMRAVHNRKYTYIYNFWADGKTKFQSFFLHNPSAIAMKLHAENDQKIAARYRHFVYRTKEELYDVESDPYCLLNLINDKAHTGTLHAMRIITYNQMRATDDPLTYQFEEEVLDSQG